jgi:hypothetical protein
MKVNGIFARSMVWIEVVCALTIDVLRRTIVSTAANWIFLVFIASSSRSPFVQVQPVLYAPKVAHFLRFGNAGEMKSR